MKEVFKARVLPLLIMLGSIGVNWLKIRKNRWWFEEKLGYPLFIKPANLGSSIGISKAKDRE